MVLKAHRRVAKHRFDPIADVGHTRPNVVLQDRVEAVRKVDSPLFFRDVAVARGLDEELLLRREGGLHRLVRLDVALASVHHPDVAVLQRVHAPLQHVARIGALVHEVQLGQHPDGPQPLRVHLPRDLQAVGVGHILVRGSHGQHDAVGPRDDLKNHATDLLGDVGGLVADGDLRQPRQVHEREVHHVRRVHAQDDGVGAHPFVAASHLVGFHLNGFPHLFKGKYLLFDMAEHSIVLFHCFVDKLQDKRAPCNNANSTRKEIISNNAFKHAALARRL
mmetsp:Transcript_16674/g.45409  ORF Transcript_16674/g.45409 Transcript_16674/m.45409 type:complete len:277 (-) Transcript_16674:152-982(-)